MTSPSTPEGPGSVCGAPNLPAGFTGTFASRYVDTGELRLHAVTGGDGPPLLLVHGWPQTWYQFRLIMPGLARDFSVVAVDQRGIGLSDKPPGGYDTATLASDLVKLMDALGHPRFALYGTDVGMPIAYALAADHRDRVDRLVVSEAPLPGISPSPPLFLPPPLNAMLWHLAFNQLPKINEQLVTGREGARRRSVAGRAAGDDPGVGAGICDAMAIQAPDGLAGIHPQGGKVVTIPLARRTARAIDLAVGERTGGPVFLAADGRRLDRHGAGRIVRRIARQAGSARPSRPTRSGTRSSRPRWMPESRAGRARGRLARGSENDDAV